MYTKRSVATVKTSMTDEINAVLFILECYRLCSGNERSSTDCRYTRCPGAKEVSDRILCVLCFINVIGVIYI